MRLLGYEIIRRNGALMIYKAPSNLQGVPYGSTVGYWPQRGYIHEPYAGAWQKNVIADQETSILGFSAVYACVTGIASDIAKMRIKLSRDEDGIWTEITANQPWLGLLRDPNHYQTHIDFIEHWMISKLLAGNTYVLKERNDKRNLVTALYVLDPHRVRTLVAKDGSVWYQLNKDPLSQVHEFAYDEESPIVPASEIIHDRMPHLWHPLVGVSPLYACAASATMGNRIQANSTSLFGNMSRPGGVVMFPRAITDEQAREFKKRWEENFGGPNIGRTAILDNGSEFKPIALTAEASQLTEQLGFVVEDVARAFHYPTWMLWSGTMPAYTKPELANTAYYSYCLQSHIEKIEKALGKGLELPSGIHVEMDLDGLLRMDQEALFDSINKAERFMKVDEQRFRANMKPLPIGGDTVYRQQQDYSIEAIAKRDAKEDPFAGATPKPPEPKPPTLPPATAKEMTQPELDIDYLKFRSAFQLRKKLAHA